MMLARTAFAAMILAACTPVGERNESQERARLQKEIEAFDSTPCSGVAADGIMVEAEDTAVAIYQILAAAYSECWGDTGRDAFREEALRILNTGIRNHPESAELRLARGIHRWMFGDETGSRADFEAALARAERSGVDGGETGQEQLVVRTARSFLKDDWEQAVMNAAVSGECDRATQMLALAGPKRDLGTVWFEVAYAAYAICAERREDRRLLDAGFALLEKGIRLHPSSVRLPAIKGYGLERIGKRKEALESLRTARKGLDTIPAYERDRFSGDQFDEFVSGLDQKM